MTTNPVPLAPFSISTARPSKAALAADGKSLSLDAWTEPLAELAVPHSEQISSLHLAWEKSPGNWVLIRPRRRKRRGQSAARQLSPLFIGLEGQDRLRRFPGHVRHQAPSRSEHQGGGRAGRAS